MLASVRAFVEDRLSLKPLRELAEHKTVPLHRYTPFYFFGGMALFLFGIQVVTGMLLMLYYRPSVDEAYPSVQFVVTTVPYGWLVRSVHAWSANGMVFCVFAHIGSVFFLRAYRKPRELTWVGGCVLLGLTLGFGFSGYLLPWNRLAYFATAVGTDIAGTVPVVGHWILRFLRGGDRVGGGTLSRFYGWHVAILPALTSLAIGVHIWLVQVHGMSVPPSVEAEGKAGGKTRSMRFFPHFAMREAFGWTLALGALAALAALAPVELGQQADAFASAPANIRPEWYFMFAFESLKLVPGGAIFGIEYESIAVMASGAMFAVLIAIPFIDRGERRHPALTAAGVVGLVYVVGMTAYGYRSFLPIVIVGVTALGTWALGRTSSHSKGAA